MSNLAHVFQGGFNAEAVEPTTPFELLAPGKYMVIVTDSEMKQTKAGDGQYLQLTHEVVDGPAKGRKLWNRLNVVNKNKAAEDIAHRTLSALCRAAGILQLQDSSQLHNIPVIADVKMSKDGQQNDIVTYASAGGSVARPSFGGAAMPVKSQAAASQSPQNGNSATTASPSNVAGTPPWKR